MSGLESGGCWTGAGINVESPQLPFRGPNNVGAGFDPFSKSGINVGARLEHDVGQKGPWNHWTQLVPLIPGPFLAIFKIRINVGARVSPFQKSESMLELNIPPGLKMGLESMEPAGSSASRALFGQHQAQDWIQPCFWGTFLENPQKYWNQLVPVLLGPFLSQPCFWASHDADAPSTVSRAAQHKLLAHVPPR